MSNDLTTVATFTLPAQAELAKNALAEAGIPAVTSNEQVIAMDWLLANAVGGIRVQVRAEDADRAAEVLAAALGRVAGLTAEGVAEDELTRQALEAVPEMGDEPLSDPPPAEPVGGDEAEGQPRIEERDGYARRLFLTAMFSLDIPPLVFYAIYLCLNAAFGPGPLSAQGRRHLLLGGLIMGTWLLLVLLLTPVGLAVIAALAQDDG